jgi:hypothetical protein
VRVKHDTWATKFSLVVESFYLLSMIVVFFLEIRFLMTGMKMEDFWYLSGLHKISIQSLFL